MIERIYACSKKKKILKKYAFLPPPTATSSLNQRKSFEQKIFFDSIKSFFLNESIMTSRNGLEYYILF